MNQDEIYATSEADKWFHRNDSDLQDPEKLRTDPVCAIINLYNLRPKRVLEVGSSNGYRLNHLREALGCTAIGVEPSAAAVEDGKKRFPLVELKQGLASLLPVADASVDLVVVFGVFICIDRSTLLRSISEMDRVLCDGGFLIIGEFDPLHPEKTPNHHLAGQNVFSFKQDYSRVFQSSELYIFIASLVYNHGGWFHDSKVEPMERYRITLLRKTLEGTYSLRSLSVGRSEVVS